MEVIQGEEESQGISSSIPSFVRHTSNGIATSTDVQKEEYDPFDYDYYKELPFSVISDYIFKIYPPLFFIVGIFGNILSIIIMRRPSFSASPTSLYFISLAGKFNIHY